MNKSNLYHKKLTGGGRCKVLLTLVMLMLLTLATSARALADDDRQSYAVFDNGTLTFYCDNQTRAGAMPLNEGDADPEWLQYASSITTVVFSESFQDARPTTCYYWFSGCSNLTEIKGIKYLNTSKVTNMNYMFYCCYAIDFLDISSFNTENVKDMSFMFAFCYSLKTILVGSGWNVANVTYSGYMLDWCEKLVGGNGTTYTGENPKDKTYAHIDGKDGNPGYLTDATNFKPYAVLEDNPDGKTKTLVFRFGYMPDNAMPLNEDYAEPEWYQYASEITTVEFDPLFQYARPTSCCGWFFGCEKLTEINGIEYLNTSKVTIMSGMFEYCVSLKSLDLRSFNTSEVTIMNGMFANCIGLRSLDLSSFNTENVTNMGNMFDGCSKLQSLNLSSFNTENVTNMGSMFYFCSSIQSLDLSSFNTSAVEDMRYMFFGCSALETILVGSGWNVDMVTHSDNMFYNCKKLTGGNGTTYQADKTDKTYAVIDGEGGDGYLTLNALTLTNENGKTTAVLNGDFADGINAVLIINKEIKVDELTFNRKFTKEVTATVMFPFGFTAGNNIKGTFHTITKVGPDKSGLWTAELSNAITDIKANTPYIFYPTADFLFIEFKGEGENKITLVPTDGTLTNGNDNGWQLHGVYSKKIWPEDSKTEYGFAAEKVEDDGIEAGEFVLAGKDAWADPMRCYLTYAGSGNPFTAKTATVLPDRIRVVFPSDNDNEITTDPAEVITPVSSVSETSDIKVWSFGGTVYIESQPDMDYTIVDLSGRIIKKGATHSTREEVTLSRHAGIVIVNINGKSVKVNL